MGRILDRHGIDARARETLALLREHSSEGRAAAIDIISRLDRPGTPFRDKPKWAHKAAVDTRHELRKGGARQRG